MQWEQDVFGSLKIYFLKEVNFKKIIVSILTKNNEGCCNEIIVSPD
ncbi:hypothetical protein HMPREF9975_08363 [Staphylococcus epidermidis NIHLM001]|nr:hypothetical protein [Staphylococcus epidermidis]EJE24160.1 hypothetical protein HMPREF9975_08363 [Staphylococcus epidermidis NIHLM001]NJI76746.1 hypothetical protein [Staphylococcus epidermidis]